LTEAQIQEGLDLVLQDRTATLIAHRLSTVRNADRIIVVDCGMIVEEGNHIALMIQAGHCTQLNNTYFRLQSPYKPGEGFVRIGHREILYIDEMKIVFLITANGRRLSRS